ncbi:MAG: hypothetical protein K2Q18_14700, partial [Bdellovibrionales bacterium]|nr:hypothetical protein [Bdellovibrionales bacterium]
MKTTFTLLLLLSSFALRAQQDIADGEERKVNGKKVIYTYKQYEKFDFDDLNIEGDSGTPSDISISPIHEKRFTNRLPYRKSFTVEIKKGI